MFQTFYHACFVEAQPWHWVLKMHKFAFISDRQLAVVPGTNKAFRCRSFVDELARWVLKSVRVQAVAFLP